MANEISIQNKLVASKGGASINASFSNNITMAGDDMLQTTQLIGTSAEAVGFGEITGAPAYVLIKNLDSTNYITVGFTNPPTEMKLLAGETAAFPPASANLYALANTAACRMLVAAVEA